MLDSDVLNKTMMGLEAWKPDVVVAVDFGMTGLLRNTLLRCFTDI